MCGHTATHILHFALEKVFGVSVRKMGSFIGPDKLHFDFVVPFEKFTLEKVCFLFPPFGLQLCLCLHVSST